ncbi:phospholipase D-like domain-containing protein [Cupriavidus agavae]|uniref:Phospholipase D-like protein n=1 Tax=Cupriavidus agavae TaxID=1001822 RepID=A0A4Q7RZF1_9BURK|nr:phospholipase D-like domain-containing protein [Cupriavidus agavae]RZT38687.1 phospholipase D-like protein [Cupriavidus agavae]
MRRLPEPITAPIALAHTTSVTTTLPWFVQRAMYYPEPCTFTPLVNGEEAFRDVHDAIAGARHSVDIICWGFQPSMFFRRGQDGHGTECIGELLETVGKRGVKVRVLCWGGAVLGLPGIASLAGPEPNMPGRITAYMRTRPDPRRNPDEFDRYWYWCASKRDPRQLTLRNLIMQPSVVLSAIPSVWQLAALRNVDFMTRDFPFDDRLEISFRTAFFGKDERRTAGTRAKGGLAMGAAAPSHHQKMVLVDYEQPECAVGYVMGHNMLDAYWDTDHHSAVTRTGHQGRNGPTPRQDISSRVTGPILKCLNHVFCESWDRETDEGLGDRRKSAAALHKCREGHGAKVMAQVLRTHSQSGWRRKDGAFEPVQHTDILAMYLQAVNNVSSFVYIENQYFRYPPVADQIKEAVVAQLKGGRDPGEHGSLHLFVVTNSTDEGMGDGTVNTYRMLDALGRADTIPGVAALERQDDLEALYAAALKHEERARRRLYDAERMRGFDDTAGARQAQAEGEYLLEQAERRKAEIKQQMNEPQVIAPVDIPGLKVHVCTLVAPDSLPGKWIDVYIHSKLMIVDDVFMTLGSANINTRSMEGDTELNICHENAAVTQPLRRRLWDIHTGGRGGQEKVGEAFREWTKLIKKNKDRKLSGEGPAASLIEFYRDDPKRTYWD